MKIPEAKILEAKRIVKSECVVRDLWKLEDMKICEANKVKKNGKLQATWGEALVCYTVLCKSWMIFSWGIRCLRCEEKLDCIFYLKFTKHILQPRSSPLHFSQDHYQLQIGQSSLLLKDTPLERESAWRVPGEKVFIVCEENLVPIWHIHEIKESTHCKKPKAWICSFPEKAYVKYLKS